jgi:carboxymethylenebutenolidase
MGETIQLGGDSKNTGYLALPTDGKGRGLLLLHAWWGLNDFFKSLANRLAAEGFVVLAPNMFGGKTASTIEEAGALAGSFESDPKAVLQVALDGLDHLTSHPAVQGDRVAAMGFSFGAAYAEWLSALRPEVSQIVLFYGGCELWGGNVQGEDFARATNAGAFLGHFAEHDDYEPPTEEVRKSEALLRAAGKQADFYVYPGTGHWFFEDNRPDAYNADAARLAWQRTVDFLSTGAAQ